MTRASKLSSSVSLAALVLAAVSVAAVAGDRISVPLKAGEGLPLDFGNKHAVTYFVEKNGACSITVVLAAADGGASGSDSPGTRVTALVMPGTALRLDSNSNESAEFFCGPAGTKMNARVFERETYSKVGKS
jgi:hypothetical protein